MRFLIGSDWRRRRRWNGPSTLSDGSAPSARPVIPGAQAAPAHPRERRLSILEARRGLSSPPQLAPTLRCSHSLTHQVAVADALASVLGTAQNASGTGADEAQPSEKEVGQ